MRSKNLAKISQNDWRDVERPQSSRHLMQMPCTFPSSKRFEICTSYLGFARHWNASSKS